MLLSALEKNAAYELFLGRSIGKDQVDIDVQEPDDLIRHFASSDEFERTTASPFLLGTNSGIETKIFSETFKNSLDKVLSKVNDDNKRPCGHVTILKNILDDFSSRNQDFRMHSGLPLLNFVDSLRLAAERDEAALLKLNELSRFERQASAVDVRQLYASLLGRAPESLAVESLKVGQHIEDLAIGICLSVEFSEFIVAPILNGKTCRIDAEPQIFEGSFLSGLQAGLVSCTGRQIAKKVISLTNSERLTDFVLAFSRRLDDAPALATFKYYKPNLNYKSPYEEQVLVENCKLVLETGKFDSSFYRCRNPHLNGFDDLAMIMHYLIYGYELYHDPSFLIDEASLSIKNVDKNPSLLSILHGRLSFTNEFDSRSYAELEIKRGEAFTSRFAIATFKSEITSFSSEAIDELSVRKVFYQQYQSPLVSIIIPVYGQLGYTLSCLDSLAFQEFDFEAEIIVVDDCSPDDERIGLLKQIPWLRYVKTDSNLGFLGACNYASIKATGEIVVFLNSDTRVCKSWLKELVGTFRTIRDAGLVGSKLYNEDSTLQEAGAVIWQDGNGHHYGRGSLDCEASEYSYIREVDYCSGAAIALFRSNWNLLGGFDPRFSPAYYEDVDLAFSISRIGLRVLYQPLAKVIHYEGKTHGTDERSGVKSFIKLNRLKLCEKWASKLTLHGNQGDLQLKNVDKSRKPKVLLIDAELPFPDRDAGSVLSKSIIDQLCELGYDISYLPTHDSRFWPGYSDSLARSGVEVYHGIGMNIRLIEDKLVAKSFDFIIGFRWYVLDSLLGYLRGILPGARIIFHTVDLHHLRLEREAALFSSWSIQSAAEDAHDGELKLLLGADCTVVTSKVELELLSEEVAGSPIVVYPFCISTRKSVDLFHRKKKFLFIGNFRHTPNKDACLFLLQTIWPSIATALKHQYELVIVGPNAPPNIIDAESENVRILGHVKHLDPILDQSLALIAPLRYGAGIKGKVLTAMAAGLPVITSALAVEGTDMKFGQDILIAKSASEYVEQVMRLVKDPGLWHRIRTGGYDFVEENYSLHAGLSALKRTLEVADSTWRLRRRLSRQKLVEEWSRADHIGK